MRSNSEVEILENLQSGDEVALFPGIAGLPSKPAIIEKTTKLYLILKINDREIKFTKAKGWGVDDKNKFIKPVTPDIKDAWERKELIEEFTALAERQNFPFIAVRQAIQRLLEEELTEGEYSAIVGILLKSEKISNFVLREATDILWGGVDA
jgi:preprotein translocase subunit YajC